MKVSQHRQTLLANNMANAYTTGFKQDLAVVNQRNIESRKSGAGMAFTHPVLDGLGGGVDVRPSYVNLAQGRIEPTGKPLDVAIDGDGFLAVSDGSETRYTRDGAFALSPDGKLVLAAGGGRWKLLDDDGATISLDPAIGQVRISEDGTIRQGQALVGKLGVVTTDDPQLLRKTGETLFQADGVDMKPTDATLVPRSLEASNFEVLDGLVTMIEAARVYQLNATMLQLQDQATGQAVTTVGRLA